jgi:hypothetical protein
VRPCNLACASSRLAHPTCSPASRPGRFLHQCIRLAV